MAGAGTALPQGARVPTAVLFVCRQNVIRSPMAAALTRMLFPQQIYCRSAGLLTGHNDPFVAAVMEEIGIDTSTHQPHTYDELEDTNFDLMVTLTPEAHHMLLAKTRMDAVDIEYWPTIDPSASYGSRTQVMDAYRGVRDGLLKKIKSRFLWRPPASL